MMIPVREVQKKYCSRSMILAIGVGMFFYVVGHTDLMKGLILGTIFSVINFILMGETLPYRLSNSRSKLIFKALGSMGVRYLLIAVPFTLALKFEEYHLITTVIGVFMIQIMILMDHLSRSIAENFRKHKERQFSG